MGLPEKSGFRQERGEGKSGSSRLIPLCRNSGSLHPHFRSRAVLAAGWLERRSSGLILERGFGVFKP